MNKNRTIATLIASILLFVALLFKFTPFPPIYALPILTVGVWVIVGFDTAAYRQEKSRIDLIRLLGFYLIAVLVTVGTVLYLLFRN